MLTPEILGLNLILMIGLILFITDIAPRSTPARLGAVMILLTLTGIYLPWRVSETLPPWNDSPEVAWQYLFFGCEFVAIVYEAWTLCVLIRLTNHSPEADVHESRLRRMTNLPTVDVFIPTYNEKEEIVRGTIRAARELDYPVERLRIWVLDDGRRPWLETICSREGVGYFARPTNEHGKAGNLNYAFPRTSSDLIVVIDADFLLEKNFLYRTIGFLLFRKGIGLVQTPQHFYNPDPVQHNLGGNSAWTEDQHFFMTTGQSARETYGNAFCVGSGWIVRRDLVEELGGFPQESLCEDLEISYVLLARGHRTLYLNEPLAFGLAPESTPEYLKQRVRWCTGTMQHLFIKSGPLRARGLSLLDRLFYLEPVLYYLTLPFMILLLISPIVFWFTGAAPITSVGDELVLILLPRFVAGYLLLYWLSEWKVMPPVTLLHKALSSFHLTAAVLKSLYRPFGRPFQVTAKGQSSDQTVIHWRILWIFAALGLALLAGMILNFTGVLQVVELGYLTSLDIVWSGFSLVVLWLCVLLCVEPPRGKLRPEARREVREASMVRTVSALGGRFLN